MQVTPIQTQIFHCGDSLADFVATQVPATMIQERIVIAVTSKIVSLAERRLVPRDSIAKDKLVERESDVFFGETAFGCFLTIKEGHFIPSAGIDESNSAGGDYILYPSDPFASARALHNCLRERWGLKEFGLILTDSRTSPLRKGVTGISLAHWGFRGVKNRIGTKDLFGRELKMTVINIADALAAAAVLMMGDGNESQPLCGLSGADCEFSEESSREEVRMPLSEDLYYPFFRRTVLEAR